MRIFAGDRQMFEVMQRVTADFSELVGAVRAEMVNP